MLLWQKSDAFEGDDLVQARVYAYAVDGTPILMFVLNARPDVYDVQDSQGHVLARECWRGGGSIEASQVHAQAAVREIIARLKLSV